MGDLSKTIGAAIIICMIIIAASSLLLSHKLNKRIRPLSAALLRLHQLRTPHDALGSDLQHCKTRYEALLENVDDVDPATFSAGFIESLKLSCLGRSFTAATAQSWVRQAPGILISFGLLGTFLGLTVGLQQIGDVLGQSLSPDDAMKAVSALMAPMSTAFLTSLWGLSLSLGLLLCTQLNGTRSCLERCESLLSSWLETVLPQQLGVKLMTPLRKSIEDLNSTVTLLPSSLSNAVAAGMQESFNDKLKEIFDAQVLLASEASSAVRSLSSYAGRLNESGLDFLEAAQIFRHSDFATTLADSVRSLLETRQQLCASTESLSKRLFDVRDGLFATQAHYTLLAKIAEQELEASRQDREYLLKEVQNLRDATASLQQSSLATAESSKQLKEARLEVMRDRRLAIKVATAIQQRLSTDNAAVETCQAFASSLNTVLISWNANLERLNELSNSFVLAVTKSKQEDDARIMERSRQITGLIEQLRTELNLAVHAQRDAWESLSDPMANTQVAAQNIFLHLEQLQSRLSRLSRTDLQGQPPSTTGV